MRRVLQKSGHLMDRAARGAVSAVEKSMQINRNANKKLIQDGDGQALDIALKKYEDVCGRLQARLEEIDGVWGEVGRICQGVGQCGIDAFGDGLNMRELKIAGDKVGKSGGTGGGEDMDGLKELIEFNKKVKEMRELLIKRGDCMKKKVVYGKKLEEWRRKPDKNEQKQNKVLHYEKAARDIGVEIDQMTLALKQNVQYFDEVHVGIMIAAMKGFAEANKRRTDGNPFGASVEVLTKCMIDPPRASLLECHPQNVNEGDHATYQNHEMDPSKISHYTSYTTAGPAPVTGESSNSSLVTPPYTTLTPAPYDPSQPPPPPGGPPPPPYHTSQPPPPPGPPPPGVPLSSGSPPFPQSKAYEASSHRPDPSPTYSQPTSLLQSGPLPPSSPLSSSPNHLPQYPEATSMEYTSYSSSLYTQVPPPPPPTSTTNGLQEPSAPPQSPHIAPPDPYLTNTSYETSASSYSTGFTESSGRLPSYVEEEEETRKRFEKVSTGTSQLYPAT